MQNNSSTLLTIKGQFSILGIAIGAGATIIASALTAWGTATSKVNQIDTKIQVVEERENNHYSEVSRKLDYIINKLEKE